MKVCLTSIVVAVLLSVACLGQAEQTPSNLIGPCWVVDVKDGDTFKVRLPDESVIDVRYMGINAPELEDELRLGPEAQRKNEEILMQGSIWLELEPTEQGFLTDRDGRVLGHVFREEDGAALIQAQLVRDGLAMLDLRGLIDRDLRPGAFPIRYIDQLIAAQIDAASERRGVWALPEFSPNCDLVIAAIKFWGYEETVYLMNRGTTAIELADHWVIKDSYAMKHEDARNVLEFRGYFRPSCKLPAGGRLKIYTGPDTADEKRGTCTGCGTEQIELWWFGYRVWDQGGDTCFLLASDDAEYCHYTYPPLKHVEEDEK